MTQATGPAPAGHDDQPAPGTTAVPPLARRILPRMVTAMPGGARMLLQFGPAHSGMSSPRRPVPDLLI